jgi:hypothetical protein
MPFTETFSGKIIDFPNPNTDNIVIEDIAHSLALQCRYNGHCRTHYSVAQHSVHVSEVLADAGYNREWQLAALMHDAHEAYVGDMITPLKMIPGLGEAFNEIDQVFEKIIWDKFQLVDGPLVQKAIKKADLTMLATEALHLLPSKGEGWNIPTPDEDRWMWLSPWTADTAEKIFLNMFRNLGR